MKYRQSVYNALPSRLAGNYAVLTTTKTGAFIRFSLLAWTSACFAPSLPLVSFMAFACAFYIMAKAICGHSTKWYKFLGGATPNQLARSYNKIWDGSVNQPLVTKVIKSHQSPPTP